jgi:hypothetical protein
MEIVETPTDVAGVVSEIVNCDLVDFLDGRELSPTTPSMILASIRWCWSNWPSR